ncbi:Zn-dependent protease with chaperone function [Halogranum gelatinilyticum]|uniref:Zn-dependent protease with chaperone function n=1 Tax=Halogranum gelatinilyticum TaxID=660521 RepID=A0A1G9QLW4_9EURY|nr:M48 family metalloprotease [Halogranum gelatinilyticum]SDM12022.1 Zn-dependent protease with chaperone function [Halogranum gelatinilyticum]
MLLAAVEAFLRDWPYLTLLILLGVAAVCAGPSILARTVGVRRLSPAETETLAGYGVPVDDIRVLGARGATPTAFAVGVLPGHRHVCVTERLVETLTAAELAAVVTHERGHLRRYHVLPRIGLPVVFVVGWAAAVSAGVAGAFLGGLALVAPVTLASFGLSRWTEHDADAYVVRHGGGPALADALDRLVRDGHLHRDEAGLRRLLSRHPTLAERVTRLRGTTRSARPRRPRENSGD